MVARGSRQDRSATDQAFVPLCSKGAGDEDWKIDKPTMDRRVDQVATDALGEHVNDEAMVEPTRTHSNREKSRGTCINICNPRYLSQRPGHGQGCDAEKALSTFNLEIVPLPRAAEEALL